MRAVYGALLWRKRRLSGLYIQVLPAVRHQRLPLDPAAGFFSPAFHPVPAALGLGLGSHAPAQRGAADHRGRIHSTVVPAGADEGLRWHSDCQLPVRAVLSLRTAAGRQFDPAIAARKSHPLRTRKAGWQRQLRPVQPGRRRAAGTKLPRYAMDGRRYAGTAVWRRAAAAAAGRQAAHPHSRGLLAGIPSAARPAAAGTGDAVAGGNGIFLQLFCTAFYQPKRRQRRAAGLGVSDRLSQRNPLSAAGRSAI